MIAEIPIDSIINPPLDVDDDEEYIDEFDQAIIDNLTIKNKPHDFIDHRQTRGFKQGSVIILEDKNINFSTRPGYITVDLDRTEEPLTAHSPVFDDKGDAISLENGIPEQY